MHLMRRANLWLSIAAIVTLAGVIFFFAFGLKSGIDFTGGSLLEVAYSDGNRPSAQDIRRAVEALNIGSINVQLVDPQGAQLRFKEVSEEQHQQILQTLQGINENTAAGDVNTGEDVPASDAAASSTAAVRVDELRFDTIGPSIGQELKARAIYAVMISLLVIVGYVAWAFRKVSRPIASWKYGAVSIVALFHDIMIVVGVFALLGRYAGVEIDSAFIAALLTVLGYSVNDTIVVLDRVRENLPRSNEDFLGTVDTSISQTVARSINTTLTTVLALLALLFFGGETIHYFILALTIGIASGAYSSIFIAAPLLIVWEKWGRRRAT
jgi:preprotein translocase subunit SecF